MQSITSQIKQEAINLGFNACGITSADSFDDQLGYLLQYIEKKHYASMEFLAKNPAKRIDVKSLMPAARSVVVLLVFYNDIDSSNFSKYKISKYAIRADYHNIIKQKLMLLVDKIATKMPDVKFKCCVDTSPILEKALAQRAGLGFIGKNNLLISKEWGSYVFIGELILNIELAYDEPIADFDICGNCNKCIDACPAKAILEPRVIDSRKCISYLTIEAKSEKLSSITHSYVYGCDICQQVCPWNQQSKPIAYPMIPVNTEILSLTDSQMENLSEEEFESIFKQSPIYRIGYKRFLANIKR